MASNSDEYHLGTSTDEIERLGYQHQVWLDEAVDLWRKAGFTHGQQLLDLGCGPGFATSDLAHLVGSTGKVHAIDNSEHFLQSVNQRCQSQGVAHVTTHLSDVHQLPLLDGSLDGVFVRWLLCFVADPEKVIAEACRVLKPGKPIVIMDYFNYHAVQVFPARESIQALFKAYHTSAIKNGGSYDIGAKLPTLLQAQGFDVTVTKPICRIARPGDRLWHWVEMFNKNYVPKLVEQDLMTPETRQALEQDWREVSNISTALFFPPPMLGIVAYKQS